MGRQKIGTEYKKPTDYKYDFPENREIGKQLIHGDIAFISKTVGCSSSLVKHVLTVGDRNNEKIKTIARKLIALRSEITNS